MPKRRPNPLSDTQTQVFRDQLSQLITKAGGIKALATKCGITEGNIHHYLKGNGEPGRAIIVAIALGMGVSTDWLLLGVNTPPTPDSVPTDLEGFVRIPELVGAVVDSSDGNPKVNLKAGNLVALHRDWITQNLRCDPTDLFYMLAAESDMEPLIRVGEAMVVNRCDEAQSDGIYVLYASRRVIVKRIQLIGTNSQVFAEAEGYQSWPLEDSRRTIPVCVLGRVVWWSRRM